MFDVLTAGCAPAIPSAPYTVSELIDHCNFALDASSAASW